MKEVVLTIMCMIYKEDGSFLVQNRLKNDWPGINFPGGHVEDSESPDQACIREIKEETNLDIKNIKCCGYYEWNNGPDGKRHLCILYKTNDFNGEPKSSSEGEIFFLKEEDLINYQLSTDFIEVLHTIKKRKVDS